LPDSLERKVWSLTDAKASHDGNGSFSGYASLFGIKDDGGDVVLAGAYAATIPQFIQRGFIPWGHKWDEKPVATVADAYEDARGLHITAEFHTHGEAQAARTVVAERIQRGKFMGLSIGYAVEDADYQEDARLLKKIHLYETSLVTVPMLAPAGVSDVKGLRLDFDTHAAAVEADITQFLGRLRAGSAARLKEGRALSSARRSRMATVSESLRVAATEIDGLLAETAPPAKGSPLECRIETGDPVKAPDGLALYAAFLRTQSALGGSVPYAEESDPCRPALMS